MAVEYGLLINRADTGDTSLKWVEREPGHTDAEYRDAAFSAGMEVLDGMGALGVKATVNVRPYEPIISDVEDHLIDIVPSISGQ